MPSQETRPACAATHGDDPHPGTGVGGPVMVVGESRRPAHGAWLLKITHLVVGACPIARAVSPQNSQVNELRLDRGMPPEADLDAQWNAASVRPDPSLVGFEDDSDVECPATRFGTSRLVIA